MDTHSDNEVFARIAEREAELIRQQKPLIDDLAEIGIYVRSIYDLVSRSEPYPEAIPVLLRHMTLPYAQSTIEGIGRSLAVPDSSYAFEQLRDQYLRVEGEGPLQGFALAAGASASKEQYSEVLSLLPIRRLGQSRVLLVKFLRRLDRNRAKADLANYVDDPVLGLIARKTIGLK